MNKNEQIWHALVQECQKHVEILDYAYGKLQYLLPFTAETMRRLTMETIAAIDQFVFRFSKLQDAIGQKLFKATLDCLGEEASGRPFIDIFNRLEKLGVVEDMTRWQELRIIRNETAHEYDQNKYELAEKLNKLINSKGSLVDYLNTIVKYMASRGIGSEV